MKKGKTSKTGTTISKKNGYNEIRFDITTEITAKGKTLYAPPVAKVSLKKCNIGAIDDHVYTGKAVKPAPVVKYRATTLKKGTDYTLSYSANKNIGVATVTVTGKGNYTDSVKKTFRILPKAVKLSSVTPGVKRLTVKWKKGAGGVSYELQYSLKQSFKSKKTMTIGNTATVKRVIKGLKKGKTYYVRIRAFKRVDNRKYYSAWSDVLSGKVK